MIANAFEKHYNEIEQAELGMINILDVCLGKDDSVVDLYIDLFNKESQAINYLENHYGREDLLKMIFKRPGFLSRLGCKYPKGASIVKFFKRFAGIILDYEYFLLIIPSSVGIVNTLLRENCFPFKYEVLDEYFSKHTTLTTLFYTRSYETMKILTRNSVSEVFIKSFINRDFITNDNSNVTFYKEIFADHFYNVCSKCIELGLGKRAIKVFSELDMFQYCSLISNMLIPEEDRKDEIMECISRSLLL